MDVSLADIRPLYGFLDPHGGQATPIGRRTRPSQAALAVGGQDGNGRYYVLDVWTERVSTDELIERLYATVTIWNLKAIGGEANALQGLFLDAVRRDAKARNVHLPLVNVMQPTTKDKDYRIRTALQPLIGNGRLIVRRGLDTLVTQLTAFPRSMQKDAVDAVASLVRFIPPKPRGVEMDQEVSAKLKYLRDRGVDPRIIAEVAGRAEGVWTMPRGTPLGPLRSVP